MRGCLTPENGLFSQLPPYPVRKILPSLLEQSVEKRKFVVVSPPGSGKTTLIPLALLHAPWIGSQKVLIQEPRRLATKMVAHRLASLLGEKPGESVGWRMRGESLVSPKTKIEVVTDGVLLRMLRDDPSLEGYGALILDEYHERSLYGDLALMLSAESQLTLREELRLFALSATPDLQALQNCLGEYSLLQVDGTLHPVSIHYRAEDPRLSIEENAVRATLHILENRSGDILLFLPGVPEVRRFLERIEDRVSAEVELHPLYGDLSIAQQQLAILPSPTGKRKIVIATSIAESSLTIEGITTVIDSGWERRSRFDEEHQIERLETRRLSHDAATQRAGRAGRIEPGLCVRLWSENEILRPQREPEILRVDLSSTVLQLTAWGGGQIDRYRWPTQPDSARWERAQERLRLLGALDQKNQLTPEGKQLLHFPIAPHRALFLLRAAEENNVRIATRLVALLEERALQRSTGCDLSHLLQFWNETVSKGEKGRRLSFLAQQLEKTVSQLSPLDHSQSNKGVFSLGKLGAMANPSGVAFRRGEEKGRFLLASGRGAYIPDTDSLYNHQWVVALEVSGSGSDSRITAALALNPQDLHQLPESIQQVWLKRERTVLWEQPQQRAVGSEILKWGAITLSEKRIVDLAFEESLDAWKIYLRREGISALPWNREAVQLVSRLRRAAMNQPNRWPDWTDDALLQHFIESDLIPFQRNLPFERQLKELLSWEQWRELEEKWPDRWISATGAKYPIDYERETPTLSAPIQEFYGGEKHPSIGDGLPLRIELLSPARRPIQTTEDLPSFWKGSYADVRKEMRGRYPKHDWPEEPWKATPHRGPKKKRPA